jgi:branched-chain amino acid aminotransferase
MDQCLHLHFIVNEDLKSTCDFIPENYAGQGYVYEVVRVIDGKILFLEDHLERFYETFTLRNIKFPLNEKQLANALKVLIASNKVEIGNIKFLGGPRNPEATFWFAAWFTPHSYPTLQMYQDGVDLNIFEYKRENPNAKIMRNSFKNEVAKLIEIHNVYELLLATDGKITEGSRSNIFFIKGQTIYTSKAENVLKGITRKKIIGLCEKSKLEFIEKDIFIDELNDFEAAFLSGTSPKVLAISKILDVKSYDTNNKTLKMVTSAFDESIEAYLKSFK